MQLNKQTTVSFTGHRTIHPSTGIKQQEEKLIETITELYYRGYRSFLSGLSKGSDFLFAETILQLKIIYPDMELICVIPYINQYKAYNNNDKARWINIFQ